MTIGPFEMILVMTLPFFVMVILLVLVFRFFRKINRLSRRMTELNSKLDKFLQHVDRS